jgi:hypothetical protein
VVVDAEAQHVNECWVGGWRVAGDSEAAFRFLVGCGVADEVVYEDMFGEFLLAGLFEWVPG